MALGTPGHSRNNKPSLHPHHKPAHSEVQSTSHQAPDNPEVGAVISTISQMSKMRAGGGNGLPEATQTLLLS